MKRSHVLLPLIGLVLSACASPTQTLPATIDAASIEQASTRAVATPNAPAVVLTTATLDIEPETLAYLQEAISIMEENSLNRDEAHWELLKANAFTIAAGARNPLETYGAIRSVIVDLRDQ